MQLNILIICFVLIGMSFGPAVKAQSETVGLELGIELSQFDYQEFDLQNKKLLREHGFMPGIHIATKHTGTAFTTIFLFQLFDSTVDYDGETQAGNPLFTTSKERITNFELSLQPIIKHIGSLQPGMSLGIGFREWRRGIQATPTAIGLDENYRWQYRKFGMSVKWRNSAAWSVGINAEFLQPIHPSIEVDIQGYDKTTLALDPKQSYRISFPVEIQAPNKSDWHIVPYWQVWDMGRSNTKPLRINGVTTGFVITEPKNKTRVWGVSISNSFR